MSAAIDLYDALFSNTLPDGCRITGNVELSDAPELLQLPARLAVDGSLTLKNCRNLTSLPAGLRVTRNLNLSGCSRLNFIPADLRVSQSLTLDGCTALSELPALKADAISCRDCTSLVKIGVLNTFTLNLHGCTKLASLPGGMCLRNLNVTGCVRLKNLPKTLRASCVNLANCGLSDIPSECRCRRLKWHDADIDWNIAFRPETIQVDDIISEPNAGLRRVLIERFGFEQFMNAINAEVLHADADRGGERRLLCCRWKNDEPMLCLEVRCPSTAAVYILRVPPYIRTCPAAAAWVAGFDDERQYTPLVET